jgi:hypothetical protein
VLVRGRGLAKAAGGDSFEPGWISSRQTSARDHEVALAAALAGEQPLEIELPGTPEHRSDVAVRQRAGRTLGSG